MATKRSNNGALSSKLAKALAEIEACERSGEPLKHYAERKGLSIHALYQAKKSLRKKGVLPPHDRPQAKGRAASAACRPAPRFVEAVRRGEVREAVVAWRLRLPCGVIFESHTPLATEEVLQLVESLRGRS